MSLTNVKSALFSVALAMIIAVGGYIIGVGDVFKLNWHALINAGMLSGIVGIVSLAKSAMTNNDGKALGIQVK